jgi:hypothetical protein
MVLAKPISAPRSVVRHEVAERNATSSQGALKFPIVLLSPELSPLNAPIAMPKAKAASRAVSVRRPDLMVGGYK